MPSYVYAHVLHNKHGLVPLISETLSVLLRLQMHLQLFELLLIFAVDDVVIITSDVF